MSGSSVCCAGNAMSERLWQGSGLSGSLDQVGSTGHHQMSMTSYQTPPQQRHISLSALPVATDNADTVSRPLQPENDVSRDVYPTVPTSIVDRARFSGRMQRLPTAVSPSITDTDKLQQRGHERTSGYRGDGYRGDRIPLRYSFEELVDRGFQNVGHSSGRYPAERERSTSLQTYYHGDPSSSTAASSSYSRRLPWSENPQSQLQSQVSVGQEIYFRGEGWECFDLFWGRGVGVFRFISGERGGSVSIYFGGEGWKCFSPVSAVPFLFPIFPLFFPHAAKWREDYLPSEGRAIRLQMPFWCI